MTLEGCTPKANPRADPRAPTAAKKPLGNLRFQLHFLRMRNKSSGKRQPPSAQGGMQCTVNPKGPGLSQGQEQGQSQ